MVFGTFLISSCATNISRVDLRELHVDFSSDSVIPGQEYNLRVTATTAQGEFIDDVNHNKLNFISPPDSFTLLRQSQYNIRLRAKRQSFDLLNDKAYVIVIEIPDSDFPAKSMMWPVNWKKYNRLDYGGGDGMDGSQGSAGSGDGLDGSDGGDGSDGTAGLDLEFEVAYYDVEGHELDVESPMIVVYERLTRSLFLFPRHQITISSIGGDGGSGGDGGDGYYDQESGKTGKGGSGGSGGDGGDGGNIVVYYSDPSDCREYFRLLSTGGAAGDDGDDGSGKSDDVSLGTAILGAIVSGIFSSSPEDGQAGTITYQPRASFDALFQNVTHPDFERKRLRN